MPTVAFLKSAIMAQVAPENSEEFLRLLTEADMKLLESVRFRWTRTRITLTPEDGYVTLPPEYASILGAQVGGAAVDIHDETFEFAPEGVGDVEIGGSGGVRLIDQGVSSGQILAAGIEVSGQLTDGTNEVVFPRMYPYAGPGLGTTNYSSDGNGFARDSGVKYAVLPPVFGQWSLMKTTYAGGSPVFVSMWTSTDPVASPDLVTTWTPVSPATGTPVVTAVAATDQIFRTYKVTGTLPVGCTVRAWVHYAPVALYDSDLVDEAPKGAVATTRCPHVSALKLAMLGLIYEEQGNLEKSGGFFAAATKRLEENEGLNRGGARVQMPAPRTPGVRKLRSFR